MIRIVEKKRTLFLLLKLTVFKKKIRDQKYYRLLSRKKSK